MNKLSEYVSALNKLSEFTFSGQTAKYSEIDGLIQKAWNN